VNLREREEIPPPLAEKWRGIGRRKEVETKESYREE